MRYPLLRRLVAGLVLAALPAQNVLHESLSGPAWRNTYGGPYVTRDVADSRSGFGKVVRINYIWWLEHRRTAPVLLNQGTYRATFGIVKTGFTAGRFDLETYASFDGKPVRATTPASAQGVNQRVPATPLTFEITRPTRVSFGRRNLNTNQQKPAYSLDSFAINRVAGGAARTARPMTSFAATPAGYFRNVASTATGYRQVSRLILRGVPRIGLTSADIRVEPGRYLARWRFRKTVSQANTQLMNSGSTLQTGAPARGWSPSQPAHNLSTAG